MDDEIIEVNKNNFSLRKILEEDGWKIYCKASEKVKSITRLMVRMDLSAMEIGFARLNRMFNTPSLSKKNTKEDGFPPTPKGVGIQPTIL